MQEGQSCPVKAPLSSAKWDFRLGVSLACCIGLTNGSFLVPLKYAQKDVKGIIYVLSFGIGAALVCYCYISCLICSK